MKNNTITYESAIFWQKQEQIIEQENREDALQEIKDTCIDGLDAADVNYMASAAGIHPNEARRLFRKPNDSGERFMAEVNSFENDETDNIIDYF